MNERLRSSLWLALGLGTAVLGQQTLQAGELNLFNGRDLTGWDGNPKFWSVRDGCITGQTTRENPTPGNTFLIWTNGVVDDFELQLQYKIVGGNSGIQYRSKHFGNWVVGGYQGDFEAGTTFSGILYEERGRGILAQRGQKTIVKPDPADPDKHQVEVVGAVGDPQAIQAAIRKEDWNDYRIVARGNHFQHFINGLMTVDVTDQQPSKAAASGILALQLHAGPPMLLQFKNIRLTPLAGQAAESKKIVFVAGRPSHGRGSHEHRAGCLLLAKCLSGIPNLSTHVVSNGWPTDESVFNGASAIIVYSDGGGGHPFIQGNRLKVLGRLMKEGTGLGCLHYAVEVPKERGGAEFLDWIGGYFETYWSVNPFWTAEFKSFPDHPVSRGVQPFKMKDEWYYHMRFRENMAGVTPILSAVPPDSTRGREGANDPHGGNPHVFARKGMAEHLLWVAERPDGGRGFGFTGGHDQQNWADDNFRKVVLNAILWTAKIEVPEHGVASSVTESDLAANLDPK